MITEAIILAGGLGTRLRTVIADLPKPMAPVRDEPFLAYLLRDAAKQGIERAVLSVGYQWETIQQHFGNKFEGIELVYAVEAEPLGTGGGIALASTHCTGRAVAVLNGDSYFGCDLQQLAMLHHRNGSLLSLALKEMENFDRYGTVQTDAGGRILAFEEKKPCARGFINAGVYVMQRELWQEFSLPSKFSFEKDVMEAGCARLPFFGFPFKGYFIDIGIPADYERAQRELQ